MRKKLFGKLLSVALSATMAVTSAVPAYAADSLTLTDTDQEEELIEEETSADDVTKNSDTDDDEVKENEEKLTYGDVDENKPGDDQENAAAKESRTSLLGAKSASNDPEEEIELEDESNSYMYTYNVGVGGNDTNGLDGTRVTIVTGDDNKIIGGQVLASVPEAKIGYHKKSEKWCLDEAGDNEVENESTEITAENYGGNLYAVYVINTYSVTYQGEFFDSEGQAVTGETPEVTFDTETYPTSVDYSSSWYGSLADGPIVENYSFEGWYTDEWCTTENKAKQDTMDDMEYNAGGMTINLYAKYVQNSEDTGDLKIVDGGDVSYAYGKASSDTVTYTAQAYEKVWKDYENATWSVYEIVDSTITSSDEARYASSNLSEVTSDELAEEYGISFAKSTSDAAQLVFKTTGPKKALDGNYLLKITNSDGSKEAVLEENFKISDAAIAGLSNITFDGAEMGYSVKSANYAGAETNITKAVEEVISIGQTLDEKYAINDLTYEWVGNDPEAFEIESDGKGVYTGQSETITIKPKEGLDNYYDNVNHDGVYTADLYAKSKAFSERKKLLTVSFTVTSNLKLASATAHGGSEAERGSAREAITTNRLGLSEADYGYFYANADNNTAATNGAETVYADVYDLGTVNVGTGFNDTLVTATGGVDKISINYVGNSPFTNGITGLGSANAGVATYLISGTPTAIGEKLILLQASDVHGNKSKVVAYKLKIEGADVTYSMTGETIEAGKASASDNIVEWYAVSGYTASAESKNLVISNNSEKDIEVSVAYQTDYYSTSDSEGSTKFPIAGLTNGKVTVPKRGSSTLTITPKSGLTSGGSVSTILIIAGTGMKPTAINLSFKVNVNDLEITKPAGTYTWSGTTARYVEGTPYDLNLEIGKPFTFQIGTTASENVESVEWAITGFNGRTGAAEIKTELAAYGLSINENTGILVGTPKKALTNAGKLYVKATPTLKANTTNNAVPVPCVFNVTIKGSADEFSLTANGNTIDSSENVLDLGTISIDRIDAVSQTFNVMNVSSLDIENVKVSMDHIKKGDTYSSALTGTSYQYDTYFKLIFDEDNSNLNEELGKGFELAVGESRDVMLEAGVGFGKNYSNVGTYWIPVEVVDQADSTNGIAKFVAKIKVTDAPVIDASAITGIVANSEIKESSSTIKYTLKMDNTDETKNYTYQWTSGSIPGLTLSESGVVYGTATEAGEFEVTVTATNKKDSSITGVLTHKVVVNGNATLELKASNLSGFVNNYILLPGIIVGDEVNKTVQTFNISSNNDTAKNVKITVEDAPDDRNNASDIKESPENPYIGSTNYIGVNKTGFTEITTQGTENFSIVTKSSVAPGVYKVKITVSADNANKQVFYVIMAVVEKFAITTPTDITTKIGKAYTIKADDGTSYIEDGDLEIVATGGAGRQTITWSEAGTKDSSGSTKYYVTKNGTAGTASDVTGFTLVGSRGRIDGKATTNASTTLVDPAATTGSKAYLTATAVKASGDYSVTLKAKVDAADYINGDGVSYRDDMSKAIYLNESNLVKASSTKAFPAQEATSVTFTISSGKAEDVKVTGVTGATGAGTIEGFKNGDVYVTTTGFTYDPVNPSYTNTSLGISVNVSNYMVGISTKVKAAFSENSNFEVVNASETTIQAATNANTPGVGAFQIRPKAKLAKGTYTDTLTISGNEFESITFDVSFTVEDASYVADVIGTVDDEDVKYVENSVVTGNILSLDNYVVDATKVSETLTVANVGNSALSRVSAYEVKADGTKYATGSADTMLTVGVISTTIAAGAQNTFTIRASKNTAGVYTTYVNLHYTEGTADTAVERDVWFPVTYTVYAKDIDTINVSPETKTTITVAENYEPASAATEFVVTNTGSDVTSTLVGYTVRSTNSNFEVLPSTAEELAAGSSATFKLQPKQGKMLSAGEYTTKLRVSGGNIKTAVERDVTLVVTESEEYTIKAYTAGYDIEDTSIAEKFWNTFAYGKNVSLTSENSNATKIMDVDVDEDRTPDIALTFTFDNNVTDKDSAKSIPINKVNVKLLSTNISTATQSLTLKTTEQTAAKSGHGDTYSDAGDAHDAKFFTTVNINFYGTVVFGTTNNTEYAELKTNLENDNVVVQTTVGGTGANKNNAKGTITAYVPFASKLGSVFASGKLPTAVSAGSIMNAWKKNGTSIIVSADRVIYSDYALDPDYHTHSYAEANNKDEKYVKWVWSTDEKGNLSTVLHLYCTDPDCPDYAGSEIVITDSALTTDTSEIAIWKNGDSLVTYDARAGKDADCEHGSRYEYPAQAKINSITYKNSYIEAEEGKPLGHQFNLKVDAEIVWTDKNSDGIMTADEVTVTRTCTRCGEPVALTVVGVSEKDRVEPTCTKDGSVQYVITYTEVTEDGKTGSNVSKDYKEVTVLKATGHAKELLAEVTDFNEETLIAEKLTLTCPDCGDVLFEGTKLQFTKNEDGTYGYKALIASTGEYYTVSYTNHAHVWDGVWSWSADNSQATLTITCTQGSRPEVREFTVDAVVTKKGAEYTYTVSKTYTWTEKGEAKTKDFSETKTVVKTDDGKAIEDVTKISDGIYIEGLDDDYWYTGNAIQPTFDVIDASERLVYLVKGVDYTVSYKNNKEVGTAQIIVKGKGNYAGQSTEGKFEIKDPKKNVEKDAPTLKGAKLELPKKVSYSYTGAPQYPAYLTLTLKGLSAVQYDFDGTSYYDKDGNEIPAVWTISNNLNKGTATITLTGPVDGKSNVQIKKTFSIKAAELATGNTTVEVGEENWSAKGALPPVTVTWKSAVTETSYQLVQGLDYTVTYNNNKVPGSQAASVTIKGKGNFSKTLKNVAKFDVGALELDDNMIRSATVYGGVKGSAVKVTLLDPYNDVIPASKYQVIVTDMNDAQVTSAKLVAGETYKVTVTPKAKTTEFTGEASQEFVAGLNLASASVKLNKGFEKTFTGEYIELTEDDFKNIAVSAKVNKVATPLEYGTHFTVTGYTNNLKKGTMTVTITGTGEADENGIVFSGTKTFKVKIVAKTLK